MHRMHILNIVDQKGHYRVNGFAAVAVDDVNVNCVRDVFENFVISV